MENYDVEQQESVFCQKFCNLSYNPSSSFSSKEIGAKNLFGNWLSEIFLILIEASFKSIDADRKEIKLTNRA